MKTLEYILLLHLLIWVQCITAQDVPLTEGFIDHGVASPISNHRGIVASIDGNRRNIVLTWLFDHRGGYALLLVDAETGDSEEFTMPFPPGKDTPYSSILSSKNKFYTLFNGFFVEFDPVQRSFTFHQAVSRQMAMGMTEDDDGLIWAVTYPNSGVISFDPKTQNLTDYGFVYKQNWQQYQRYVAADDAGWIYFGLGNTVSQIITFNPESGEAKPMLKETERKRGSAYVYRNENGKVYGQALVGENEDWHELYKGGIVKIGKTHTKEPVKQITGSQALFHRNFPDGKRIEVFDLVDKRLEVYDPATNTTNEVKFDYSSEGAWVMGVGASPDSKISGGTAFPMRFFSYDPKTDEWINKAAPGQFNALARQGDSFFFGVYPRGSLIEWKEGKPIHFIDADPTIIRPHRLLACPDGKTLVMGGTPQYGYTGGGLLFWNRENKSSVLLSDSSVIVDQSTMSLEALPNRKIIGGTTTAPGTGGEKKATQAEIYIMDIETKRIEWHEAILPNVQSYTDMCTGPEGLVYAIADRKIFFVFDVATKEIIHQEDLTSDYSITTAGQSTRAFVSGEEGNIYILLSKGIAQIEADSYKITLLAESPVPIDAGGAYLDGRLYFLGGSHLYSYHLVEHE